MQFELHGVIQLSTIIIRSVSGTCKAELKESIPEVPAPGDEDILCKLADTWWDQAGSYHHAHADSWRIRSGTGLQVCDESNASTEQRIPYQSGVSDECAKLNAATI